MVGLESADKDRLLLLLKRRTPGGQRAIFARLGGGVVMSAEDGERGLGQLKIGEAGALDDVEAVQLSGLLHEESKTGVVGGDGQMLRWTITPLCGLQRFVDAAAGVGLSSSGRSGGGVDRHLLGRLSCLR